MTFPARQTKRGFDARSVGAYVPGLTRKAFEKYGFSAATLLTDWAAIVGADLARITLPERLAWPKSAKRGGEDAPERNRPAATLTLAVDPARALDIQFRGRETMERINAYFGYRAITRIKIRQAHLPLRLSVSLPPAPPAVQSSAPHVDGVTDPTLRAALTRMAHGIVMRRQG